MARARQSKSWWTSTVARWRRSGLTAAAFATQEGLSVSSLRRWSSALSRDTRAKHGLSSIEPIEIAVPSASRAAISGIEVAIGDARIRWESGVDVDYVAALVALSSR
jgi:hypothetical protein